jgi:hypothetical protein
MEEMKDVQVKQIQFGFGEYPLSLKCLTIVSIPFVINNKKVDGERQVLEDSFKPCREEVHVEYAKLKQQK